MGIDVSLIIEGETYRLPRSRETNGHIRLVIRHWGKLYLKPISVHHQEDDTLVDAYGGPLMCVPCREIRPIIADKDAQEAMKQAGDDALVVVYWH